MNGILVLYWPLFVPLGLDNCEGAWYNGILNHFET